MVFTALSFQGTKGATDERPNAGVPRLNGSLILKMTRQPSAPCPTSRRPSVEVALCRRKPAPCSAIRRGSARPDSTGQVVDGYQVRIVDEQGADVPPGEPGDLIVRGPSTATHYHNRREQTRAKMRGEWFFTGDKFRQTADGDYHYVGRSDDMFKVGGEWVSPTDLEAVLVAHESVLEAAITSREDAGLLQPQAHVVLMPGQQGTPDLAEELRQHVRARCAGFMVPREVRFVAELPKTATGKVQRYLLRGEPA